MGDVGGDGVVRSSSLNLGGASRAMEATVSVLRVLLVSEIRRVDSSDCSPHC